ncbi:UNVERIFIED_CONTAM: hypothetical protein FKN15_013566 [Acipenser sinensis]
MGRKSCRKQRKEQLVPQAAVATPLPPLPPGSPPSREIWDWLVHPEGNFAFDLPCVISTLCLRDGERWADWEKQHNPASVRDLTMVVLGYLAADMGGIPPSEQEEECLLVPPLQPEGEEALPPSQPEGEEALPPSQPEGEEPLPPSQPEGEEPLPPSQPEGEEPLPPS